MKNRKVVLAARPDGQLKESDMRVVEEEVAELGDGMVLLQVEHLSIDAFIRTTFDEAAFHGTAELGNAIIALGTARVLDREGDLIPPIRAALIRTQALLVLGEYGREIDENMVGKVDFPLVSRCC